MEIDSTFLSDESYTVIASGVSFSLTRAQIEVDSPSYFTSAFQTEGFSESASRIIKIDKNPLLFKYITLYLSGYTILPLQLAAIPITMSLESALENLLIDAIYFDLDGLIEQIGKSRNLPKSISLLEQLGYDSNIIDFADLLSGAIVLEQRSRILSSDFDSEVTEIQVKGAPAVSGKIVIRMSGIRFMLKSSNQGYGIRTAQGYLDQGDDRNQWRIYGQSNYSFSINSDHSLTFKHLEPSSTLFTAANANFEIDLGSSDARGPIEIDGTLGTIQQLSRHFRLHLEEHPRQTVISMYQQLCERRCPAKDTFNSFKELINLSTHSSVAGPDVYETHEEHQLDLFATELYVTCKIRSDDSFMSPFTYISSKCLTESTALRKAFS